MNLNQVHRVPANRRPIASWNKQNGPPGLRRDPVVPGSLLFDRFEREEKRGRWRPCGPRDAVMRETTDRYVFCEDGLEAETLLGLVLGESTPSLAETLAGVELCQFSSDLVSRSDLTT